MIKINAHSILKTRRKQWWTIYTVINPKGERFYLWTFRLRRKPPNLLQTFVDKIKYSKLVFAKVTKGKASWKMMCHGGSDLPFSSGQLKNKNIIWSAQWSTLEANHSELFQTIFARCSSQIFLPFLFFNILLPVFMHFLIRTARKFDTKPPSHFLQLREMENVSMMKSPVAAGHYFYLEGESPIMRLALQLFWVNPSFSMLQLITGLLTGLEMYIKL